NAPLRDETGAEIGAVCMPTRGSSEPKPGVPAYVIGWGETQDTGDDLVLRETSVPVLSNQLCQKWMPDSSVTSRMVCAGYAQGGKDSCNVSQSLQLQVIAENNGPLL